jgi:hypothetical protein
VRKPRPRHSTRSRSLDPALTPARVGQRAGQIKSASPGADVWTDEVIPAHRRASSGSWGFRNSRIPHHGWLLHLVRRRRAGLADGRDDGDLRLSWGSARGQPAMDVREPTAVRDAYSVATRPPPRRGDRWPRFVIASPRSPLECVAGHVVGHHLRMPGGLHDQPPGAPLRSRLGRTDAPIADRSAQRSIPKIGGYSAVRRSAASDRLSTANFSGRNLSVRKPGDVRGHRTRPRLIPCPAPRISSVVAR